MNDILKQCLWQGEHLGGALEEVARRAGLYPRAGVMPESIRSSADTVDIGTRLDLVSSQLGLEADPLNITYGDVETALQAAAPALFEYVDSGQHGFFVLLKRSWRKIVLLKPDRSIYPISRRELLAILSGETQESHRKELDQLLSLAGISPAHRAQTLDVLLKEKLKNKSICRSWRLRLNPGSDFWLQIRQAGVLPLLAGFFVSHAVTYLVYLFFWRVLGQAVFA